ncbi:Npt1/Npt2 family nucleotide transporter [Candidatus Cardinium hertigii]|uniref:ADP,ATP carrier protein n=1 Tax=Candidatus Cardinium hertigii TaxID=247481 RepID=A0A2Z3L9J1_9BACT|nr:Npt1/Npt2 family nucleotide transporter [Candidatus Cardinium hertigii]AWN82027.1 ADP,ATP carrier protein 1 [Candidatus Cardinium hertigii]
MTKGIVSPRAIRWLQLVFPIKKRERKKVSLLILLKFLISLVYSLLATLKDTKLVTAHHSAAEIIPIIKGAIVFPLSIAVLVLYAALFNRLKPSTLFYGTVSFFLLLILLYGFVLYPNADRLTPDAAADWLQHYTGGKQLHWVAVFRYWIHVVFFVIAELWGQIVLMLLYWSFVNSVCTLQEAKRLYALLITAGDVALLVSAPLINTYTNKYSNHDFLLTIQALIGYVAVFCLAILLIYGLANHTLGHTLSTDSIQLPRKKLQLTLWQSLKHVATSKYLASIALATVACGLSMNIVEGTCKAYLKEAFPKESDYQNFYASISFWTGVTACCFSFFLSGGILRKFGWKITARIAPLLIGAIGCFFFLMSYGRYHFPFLSDWLTSKQLILYIATLGAIHMVIAKATKYAFFDKTTQMAYIPLDPEAKIKGKAIVDLLGSRLGKAGSAWIQIALLEFFHTNSIQPLSGILFIFLCTTTICWYKAIGTIDKQMPSSTET